MTAADPPPVEHPRPVTLTGETRAQLNAASTATLAAQLQRRGIRNVFLSGLRPVRPGRRMLGYAFTLRYVPMREDLLFLFGPAVNAQRRAVEGIGPDEVLVIDARGEPDAGTIGDMFALRAWRRGATGIVTDGAIRDSPAVRNLDIPVYSQASHATTLARLHLPLDVQVPVACAGVTVMPGDVLVGDDEGVVVVPAALAAEVAADAARQELEEAFAFERIDAGESSIGVFPLSSERRADFEAWLSQRAASGDDPAAG